MLINRVGRLWFFLDIVNYFKQKNCIYKYDKIFKLMFKVIVCGLLKFIIIKILSLVYLVIYMVLKGNRGKDL